MNHFLAAVSAVLTGRLRSICVVVSAITMVFPVTVAADPLFSPFLSKPTDKTEAPVIAAAYDGPMGKLMQSVVTVNAMVPDFARTAASFGTDRQGTGVVIDANGLIVTAGYTIAEATSVTVTFTDGRTEEAEIVAYDESTGLGLVRTPNGIATTPIKLGKSSTLKTDQTAMIIPSTGEVDAKGVKVGKIKKFTGGWEFIVDNAIHTYPPSTLFTGAALVSDQAELLGIGALVTIDIDIDPKVRVPGNIFVPVDLLTAHLGELIVSGRSQASIKPWLGLDTKQTKKGVVVRSVVEDGPAANSGVRPGDVIVAVNLAKVSRQAQLFEKIWSLYEPGDDVHLMVLRDDLYTNIPIASIDYYDWLRLNNNSDTVISEMTE